MSETAEKRAEPTPGPWRWVNSDDDEPWAGGILWNGSLRTIQLFGEDKTEVIDGKRYTSFALPKFVLDCEVIAETEEFAANARLIAAAPDLLYALEELIPQLTGGNYSLHFAVTAVAKALGRESM